MTKTLRDLVEMNDFTDYDILQAHWQIEPGTIEAALYGDNANHTLRHDFTGQFAEKHPFEIIPVNSDSSNAVEVGLAVLRVDGEPTALYWRENPDEDPDILFLSDDQLEVFRSKWEAAKSDPDQAPNVIAGDVLDMPLAEKDAVSFSVFPYGADGMPGLDLEGVKAWIDAEGGLEAITDIPALQHAVASLERNLQDRDRFLTDIRGMAEDLAPETLKDDTLLPLIKTQRALTAQRDEITAHLAALQAAR